MKVKTGLVLVLVALTSAAGLWAAGQQEGDQSGTAPPWSRWSPDKSKEVEVTGAVKLGDHFMPELVTKDKTYELMVPRYLYYNIDVKEGQTITVKGYEYTGPMPPSAAQSTTDENDSHLWVTSAVINGKEYKVDHDWMDGMMGGRGKGGMRGGRSSRRPGGMGGPDRRPAAPGARGAWR